MAASLVASVFDSPAGTPCFQVIPKSQKHVKKSELVESTRSSQSTKLKEVKLKKSPQDERADRTVFVGNIPSTCTKRQIKQLFKQRGSVESIRLRSLRVSSGDVPSKLAKKRHQNLVEGSTFNAYVVMSSSNGAENCLGLNGTIFQGRHLRVDILAGKKSVHTNQRSVFIGNLPFSADEEKVREVFSICGDIENVRIIRDPKSGIGKGFGFVTFVDTSGVIFALKQNNKVMVDQRSLRVTRSKDQHILKEDRQSKISGLKCAKKGCSNLHSGSIVGKRRPDGTKNRHYRIPRAP